MMKVLEAVTVSKSYRLGAEDIPILRDISLSVSKGEFIVIEGQSGSGKSTLLTVLSGLDRPSAGQVFINGIEITTLSEDRLAPFRNQMFGFVFQAYHLIPSLTALENIAFPAELKGDRQARAKAFDLMQRVGLSRRASHFPHQLSGGEKQRVAICRALVNQPLILFADEPTGNLDSRNSAAIVDLLLSLRREHGATLILVTHSRRISRQADRVFLIEDGGFS